MSASGRKVGQHSHLLWLPPPPPPARLPLAAETRGTRRTVARGPASPGLVLAGDGGGRGGGGGGDLAVREGVLLRHGAVTC